VILPVVLMGDRGLPKGVMVRSGWGGVLKGARDSIVQSSCQWRGAGGFEQMTMDHWQWCRQQEIRGKKWGSEGHRWQAGSKTGGRGR